MPIVFDETIKINDPVYTFDRVMKGVNLRKYLVSGRKDLRGRTGYNPITMLKVVLFEFQLKGYASTREITDLCYNDRRIVRKGLTQVKLELNIIDCAFNIYKYHNKLQRKAF